MGTIVGDIHAKILSIGQTTLGNDWVKLRRVFTPSENDLRTSDKAFGARHGPSNFTDGVTKHYTNDMTFEVLLVRRYVDRNDDAAIQTTINELYSVGDSLLNAYIHTKLELNTQVLNVFGQSFSTPEVLENNTVLLIMSFDVKYRRLLT